MRIDRTTEGVTIDGADTRADVMLSIDFFSLVPDNCELSFSGCSSYATAFNNGSGDGVPDHRHRSRRRPGRAIGL